MIRTINGFRTLREARAFARGVELVNDSALEVLEVYPIGEGESWAVRLEDQDYDEDVTDRIDLDL
jgi:hypothetical protein